jgi:hypothetical protein
MNVDLTYELDRLSSAMRAYAAASGKAESEILTRTARKLTNALWQAMRELMPKRGSIREGRLAALKSGGGVRVRPAVEVAVAARYGAISSVAQRRTYLEVNSKGKMVASGRKVMAMSTHVLSKDGKPMNLRALAVEREIAVRESGIGFLARSVPKFKNASGEEVAGREIFRNMSKLGFAMSELAMNNAPQAEVKFAMMKWFKGPGLLSGPTEGLTKPKQREAFARAIQEVTSDTMVYVERKQRMLAQQHFGA